MSTTRSLHPPTKMITLATTQPTATQATTKALGIPELLENIFLFVDPYTLRRSIVLVCRSWFFLNRHKVQREFVWDLTRNVADHERIQSRLLGAWRLWWYYGPPPAFWNNSWLSRSVRLIPIERWLANGKKQHSPQSLLDSNKDQQQQQENGAASIFDRPLLFDHQLRELEISGHHDKKYCLSLLHLFPSLVSLKVEWITEGHADMFELFVRCPLLESLHLESKAAMGLRQPWTKDRQESSAHTLAPEEQERTKDDGSTSPLRLRSFVTRNACLVQSDLEQFLLLTPKLTTLRLINLKPRCDYYYTDVTYNWPQLRDHIRGIPMQLESFYYSDESSPWSVSEGINAALTVCPNTPTEWTLEIAKLRSPMIRSLQKLPNVVTVLDLTFHFAGSGQLHDEGLHAYLCSSPHLLHLRAPNTPLYLQQLDLHHRWNDRHSTLSASAAKLSPPGIWACRRLKTLEFHLCAYTDSSATEQSHQAPLRSRILFGYISRVCPDLRHLFIDTAAHTGSKKPAEHALSFLLKGGFCLLTQLTHLESLTVGAENRDIVCRTVDLAWMTPAGYGIRRRRERRTELQSWEDQLAAEQREETLKSRMKKKEAPGIAAATATGGNDLREALKDLGRLKEVKDLLVEMDGRECRCWPVLDKVAIYRANRVGRTKEAELERFFPSKLPTL